MWLEIVVSIVLIILCHDVYFWCGRVGKVLKNLPTPSVTLPFIGNGFHYFTKLGDYHRYYFTFFQSGRKTILHFPI